MKTTLIILILLTGLISFSTENLLSEGDLDFMLKEQVVDNIDYTNKKFNTSLINVIALGDLNFGLEARIEHDSTFLWGCHLSTSTAGSALTGKYGAFGGYRLYMDESKQKLLGSYLQASIGINTYTSDTDSESLAHPHHQ